MAVEKYHRLLVPPRGSFFLYGVRGVGKSTWTQNEFPDAYLVDLLDESRHQTLLANPGVLALELADVPPGRVVVLDEIQRVPALLNEVHRAIEGSRRRFVLLGSSARRLKTANTNLLGANQRPNVVPGVVRHTIELRDLSAEKIARLAQTIKGRARQIAEETRTEITITPTSHHEAALATPWVQQAIEEAAGRVGLRTKRLPSGAGHDAQMMALLGPMGMIFVPSIGGISHSPNELTRWEDCANGANVLLETVLALSA